MLAKLSNDELVMIKRLTGMELERRRIRSINNRV